MKTTLALIIVAAISCGCNTTKFSATKPDGTKVEIENRRCVWSTENYTATLKGDEATLTANKSNVDKEALGVVVSAAVSAAAKSVVP